MVMAQSFEERVTDISNVGMTINNLGMIGNAFKGDFNLIGSPSAEYPVNSGVEHTFQGGIWFGALINGNQIGVSTAYADAANGYTTGAANFEMTAEIGQGITERSIEVNSPFYSPNAVSQQDFISFFTDKNITIPGTDNTQINGHDNPMGLDFKYEVYNWNFPFADFFVILDFEIINNGPNTLDSVYVGFLVNGVVRNVNITPPGGGPFYSQGGNGYLDTLFMSYDFDATGDPGFTDSYQGEKFLGASDKTGFKHPSLDPNFKLHYNTWFFRNTNSLLYSFPGTEQLRYQRMTQGLNFLPCWDDKNNPACIAFNGGSAPALSYWEESRLPGNRSNLISVGPFAQMLPGDTVRVAFAMVYAPMTKTPASPVGTNLDLPEERSKFYENAGWAQTAFNGEDANFNGILDPGEDLDGNGKITRYILPTPPDIPITRIEANDNFIDLYWSNNSERSIDPISQRKDFEGFRIYLSKLGFDVADQNNVQNSLVLYKQFDKAANKLFFDTGFDSIRLETPRLFEGDTTQYTYRLRISNVLNGWQYAVSVTAFDDGDAENGISSLESSRLGSLQRAYPGTRANTDPEKEGPFVYPNPYYAGASWEGPSIFEEDRKLNFANLPARCVVRIFSSAGDLVDEFNHNSSYDGSDIRWYGTYSESNQTVFSGGEHSWDLLSKDNQIISRGLYVFSVEDLETGKSYNGQFVIIK
jgi:hypothetical protein